MKKLISSIIAVLMVATASVPVFAATTVAKGDNCSISISNIISQNKESVPYCGYDDSLEGTKVTDTVYTVPVGAEIVAEPSVGHEEFDSNGKFITGGLIDQRWTITPKMSGELIYIVTTGSSVHAYLKVSNQKAQNGSTQSNTASTKSAGTSGNSSIYKSDTGAKLSLMTGSTYQFKITSLTGKHPSFVLGGKSFKGIYEGNKGKDYFYKITALGKNGDSVGVYINDEKKPCTVLSINNAVKIDTGKNLTVKPGKTYQFKITALAKPTFVSGTPSAFKVFYNGNKINNYFFVVKAIGKAGQGAGLYLNGSKTPVTIGTIS